MPRFFNFSTPMAYVFFPLLRVAAKKIPLKNIFGVKGNKLTRTPGSYRYFGEGAVEPARNGVKPCFLFVGVVGSGEYCGHSVMRMNIHMSHVLVPEEFVFVNMLSTVCVIYTLFMVMVGTMKVHDFEFGKFLFTSLLTFIAMIIVIFLISLMFLLTQQLVGWIQTLIVEMKYR